MKCDHPSECHLEAEAGLVIGDRERPEYRSIIFRCGEHVKEVEAMVRVSSMRPVGLRADLTLEKMTVEEAIALHVMEG